MTTKRKSHIKTGQKKMNAGSGQRDGKDYKPALTVRSFGSRGKSSRIPGQTASRTHHALSTLEQGYVYILDMSLKIVDLKEQFALPLAETEAIARVLGVKHPTIPGREQEHAIMTTDFVLTVEDGVGKRTMARTIKWASDLSSTRTLEKLEIERLFWLSKGVDWGILSEIEISQILIKNCDLIHPRLNLEGLSLTETDIKNATKILTKSIIQKTIPLRQAAHDCDEKLGFETGSSLAVAYYLMVHRIWKIDLYEPLDTGKILNVLSIKE